MIYFIYLGHYN